MPNDAPRSISITLSPAQVEEVVRAASHSSTPSLSTLIAGSLKAPPGGRAARSAPAGSGRGAGRGARGRAGGGAGRGAHGGAGTDRSARGVRGSADEASDQRLSRSLLRGLSLLTGFGPDGRPRGIVELAGELGMSPSTAHRYALTLVELGLLERCPKTRKYRLPSLPS
jgi:IclR helix-turn-helix domain